MARIRNPLHIDRIRSPVVLSNYESGNPGLTRAPRLSQTRRSTHLPPLRFGRLRTGSDIDLAIAAETELSPETLSRYYLQASSLLKREVDLRDLRRAKGLYLKEVLTKGKILLNDNPQFLGNKAIEMMDYQTDLAPQINAIRRQQLERSLYE